MTPFEQLDSLTWGCFTSGILVILIFKNGFIV